jgi:osmotically-inducible protein OsmY
MTTKENGLKVRDKPESPARFPVASLQQCFHESPYSALRHIKSDICEDVVRLSGIVPSYYLKQLAQEMAMQHADVREVANQIQVGLEMRGEDSVS